MITTDNERFESNVFAIQVIAKGSFIDSGSGGGRSFLIETTTVRMNHIALNAWLTSETHNCRECYETNQEWEDHKAEYKKKRKTVEIQLIEDLGIDTNEGSICITQAQSEVFTVVHICELVRRTIMIEKTSTVYIAEDGMEFTDRQACEEHEAAAKNVKIFSVRYAPDLTEGRGWAKEGFVLVNTTDKHEQFVQHWCFNRFGNEYDFVMDVYSPGCMMVKWLIREVAEVPRGGEILARLEDQFVKHLWDDLCSQMQKGDLN